VARELGGPASLPQQGRRRVGLLAGRHPDVHEGGQRRRHRQR
jgi:hypothetical protein